MLISRRSRIWSGILLAALLLSMLGTVAAPSPARAAAAPPEHDDEFGTPLSVELSLAELPSVGKTAELTIVVSSTERAEGVQVGIVGSDGLRIDGERDLVIDLAAGESRTLSARVTPEVAGNHSVAANVSLDVGDGTVWGDSDAVYFNSGDGTATEGFSYLGDPMSGEGVPGPGNSMKFESDAFPDGSMPAIPVDENAEIPVYTGGPGGQDDDPREGEVALAAGMLAIRGHVGVTNRDGIWQPQMQLVELLTADDSHIAYTYSDFTGQFVFNVTNPGKFRIRVRAYFWHSTMTVGAIRVVLNGIQTSGPFSLAGWYYTLPVIGPFSDSEIYLGKWRPKPTWLGHRAWWVYQDLMDGFFSTWNAVPPGVQAGSRQPDGVTAEWQPGSSAGTFYRKSSRRIKLVDVDANSRSTVLHEYGHAIMHNVYGDFPATDCPATHLIEKQSGVICAWTEGWADFFSLYVNEDPIYTHGCAQPCIPPSRDLEYRSVITQNVQWHSGDLVEGNVAASLWDFIDEHRDGHDKTDATVTPFWKIWDIVFNHNHNTFAQFWDSWTDNTNYSTFAQSLATLHENTIAYGWEVVCGDWAKESDDTHAGTASHAYPEHPSQQRYFCTDDDNDWYTLNVEAGETYVVETSNLSTASNGTAADTTLTLYRVDGETFTQLAYDDNGGSEPFASRIALTAPANVELRVVVRHKDGIGHPFYRYMFDLTWVNDNVAPSVTAPTYELTAGSTLGNPAAGVYTVDVNAEWTASDPDDGIAFQSLQGQVDNAGFVMLEPSLASNVREHSVPLTIDTVNQLQVSATDTYGFSSGYATGDSFALVGTQDRDFTYGGEWTSIDAESAWGGSYMSTNGEASPMIAGVNTSGATATYTFLGSSVALVGMTAPDGGYAEIYIDGVEYGRADFYAEREMPRQVVFAANGLAAGGHHTLEVRWIPYSNEWSSGTQLYLDGLIALD